MSLIWSTCEHAHDANEPESVAKPLTLPGTFTPLSSRRYAPLSTRGPPPAVYGLYPGLSVPFSVAILSSVG